jgi:hypothetical protein
MQLHTYLRKSPFTRAPFIRAMFGKAALATAALGGFLFFAGAPGAQAADDHGYSRQADRGRQEWRQGYERSDRRFSYDRDRGFDRNRDGYYSSDSDRYRVDDQERYRGYDQRFDRDRDRGSDRRSRDFGRDRD